MGRIRATALAISALLAFALTGCGGTNSDTSVQAVCPQGMVAPPADRIALFRPGGKTDADVMVGAKVVSIKTTCLRQKVGLSVFAEIGFYAQRADFSVADANLTYFVALLGPQQQVLSEQDFPLPVQFLPGESYRNVPLEKVTVKLPITNDDDGTAYTVVVGFQLTPEQLAYNRAKFGQ